MNSKAPKSGKNFGQILGGLNKNQRGALGTKTGDPLLPKSNGAKTKMPQAGKGVHFPR